MNEKGSSREEKADAIKRAKKRFPKTSKGAGDFLHGFNYLKYIHQYMRFMHVPLNKNRPDFKGNPEKIRIDFPSIYSDEENEIVKGMVEFDSPNMRSVETSEYHSKVLTYDDAQKLFSLNIEIDLPDPPKSMIPYDRARRIIIEQPGQVVVYNCPCREAQGSTGCYPRDVCLLFEPWASLVLEFAVEGNARRITREEALQIIKEEHERGHVHSAFFKDACGNALYAMCNCCSCCCACISAHNYFKIPMIAPSGYSPAVDYDKCQACGICVEACNANALSIEVGKKVVDYKKCFGCGACEVKCPNSAIAMKLDPAKGEPMDMEVILEKYINQ